MEYARPFGFFTPIRSGATLGFMAADQFAVLLAIGESLTMAQSRENHAAEAYRLNPDQNSLKVWLEAVREIERLTISYMDATMHAVEGGGARDYMPAGAAQSLPILL